MLLTVAAPDGSIKRDWNDAIVHVIVSIVEMKITLRSHCSAACSVMLFLHHSKETVFDVSCM